MSKYRKRPIEIEAIQFTSQNFAEAESFGKEVCYEHNGYLMIHTLEGVMRADPNDWIIRGVKGELYPCKPDIFEATYEAVT